jgi:uncharacterized membrane protein YgaE (UPF0421/DUF939 family)
VQERPVPDAQALRQWLQAFRGAQLSEVPAVRDLGDTTYETQNHAEENQTHQENQQENQVNEQNQDSEEADDGRLDP